MHRTGKTWLVALVALAVLGLGAWSQATAPQSNAQDGDPVAVVQAFIDEANTAVPAGDGEALAAHFTEGGYFFDIDGGSFGIIGQEALAFGFGEEPDPDFSVTVTDLSAEGNTVTGTAEIRDAGAVAAGVDRYVQHLTAVVDGDLIASIILTYDESDAQTATYLAYDPGDEGDDEFPPDAVTIEIGGNQPGVAYLMAFGGPPFIFAEIQPGDAGVWQPAAIYNGSCDALGSVASILAPVVDGISGSGFSGFTVDGLVDGDYAIGVAASQDNPVIVACGDIEPGTAPTPTPTGGGTQLPNTGSGPMSGSDFGWPLVALVALGAAAVAGSGVLRLSTRRR